MIIQIIMLLIPVVIKKHHGIQKDAHIPVHAVVTTTEENKVVPSNVTIKVGILKQMRFERKSLNLASAKSPKGLPKLLSDPELRRSF